MEGHLCTARYHKEKIPEFGESEMGNSRKVSGTQRIRNRDPERAVVPGPLSRFAGLLAATNVYAAIRGRLCYLVSK